MVDAVVDAAMYGTGFTNAAFICGIQRDETVLVIKYRSGVCSAISGRRGSSRSLILTRRPRD